VVVPPFSFNYLILLLLLLLLLLALLLALLFLWLSRRRGLAPRPRAVLAPVKAVRVRPRIQYVLPLPVVRCRHCARVIPLYAIYCPYCGRAQAVLVRRPPPVAVARRAPRGRGLFGFLLALFAGILVILNSAALLAPGFYGFWSGVFFWLPSLGPSYGFIVGMIIGLVLILGAVVMLLGHGVLGDVIVFPFAIFSLIIGGGFVAGLVLGVVGGIIAALKR
jgi:hypothetical protein